MPKPVPSHSFKQAENEEEGREAGGVGDNDNVVRSSSILKGRRSSMPNNFLSLRCPDCGGKIKDEERFCPNCGLDLQAPIAPGGLVDGKTAQEYFDSAQVSITNSTRTWIKRLSTVNLPFNSPLTLPKPITCAD